MNLRSRLFVCSSLATLAVACSSGVGGEQSATGAAAVTSDHCSGRGDCGGGEGSDNRAFDFLAQAGTGIVPLAITDDDYVVYQQGQNIFVTAITPNASATLVGTSPGTNTAFAFAAGKVAFIWTNPNYSLPGFGVSPLVIWTAAHGAQAASTASPIGILATASSSDGERVTFPTNSSDAAGTQGDLVLASADLHEQQTLLSSVPMLFGSGPCVPEVAFLNRGGWAYPVVAHCVGTATNATLSTFPRGVEQDVLSNLGPGPAMTVDVDRREVTTTQMTAAGVQQAVLVTEEGATTLDTVPTTFSILAGDGSVLYSDHTTTPPGVKRAVLHGSQPVSQTIVPQNAGVCGFGVGSVGLAQPPTDPNRRSILHAINIDPTTGLTDLAVTDIHTGNSVTLDSTLENTALFGNPFTADSAFALALKVVNPTTFAGPFTAWKIADQSSVTLSDTAPNIMLTALGGVVAVTDNLVTNATNSFASTADLKIFNLATGTTPRVVDLGVNANNLFVNHAKTAVVYVSNDAGKAGIRVTNAF